MAVTNTNSVQYALRVAKQAGDHTPIAPSDAYGKLRGFFYTQTIGVADATSTVKLCRVPAGARFVAIQHGNTTQAASVTFQIGDSGDPDRLMAATAVTTAVVPASMIQRSPTTVEPDIGFGYKYTAETDIILTVAGAATQAGLMWGIIWFLVE